MAEYRAYFVGADEHFVGSEWLLSDNDDEAIKMAQRLVDDRDVELWSGDRLVVRLRHKPCANSTARTEFDLCWEPNIPLIVAQHEQPPKPICASNLLGDQSIADRFHVCAYACVVRPPQGRDRRGLKPAIPGRSLPIALPTEAMTGLPF
jgi:hypothetical protein